VEARNITTLITRYAKFAPELTGNGYDTTPLDGKKPILQRWQHRPNTALEFNKYNGKNTGILCGGLSHLFAVDVDVYTKEVAEIIKGFAIEMLGEAPERIGQAPKTMLIYRLSEPTRKLRSIIVNIDQKDCAVEILAEGQQFVASGIHDSGVNYSWPGDNLLAIPINELTEVFPAQLQDFLALVNQTLLKYGEQKQSINHDGVPKTPDFLATTELEGKKEEIDIALAHIPNFDLHYEDWVYQAHALKGALQNDGFELFDKWSKRSDKYDAKETERVWNSIGAVNNVGAGTIFHQAKEYGFEVSEHRNHIKAEAKIEEIKEEQVKSHGSIIQSMAHAPEENDLPRRRFLYGKHLIREYLSSTISPGGIGKTTLVFADGASIVTGRPLMGLEVHEPNLRFMHINLEDPFEELCRQYYATLRYFKINHNDVKDRFALHSGRDKKVIVAELGENGDCVQMPDYDWLRQQIKNFRPDVLNVDPMIKVHYLDENNNKHVDYLCTMMAELAGEFNLAIDMPHHTRKAPTGATAVAGDANQARGAGSLIGAVRSARTLTPMTAKEGATFGIRAEDAPWYIRVDNAKANLSAPSAKAKWFKRESVTLDNGDDFEDGDSVGILEPWSPPDPFDGITNEQLIEALYAIEKGPEDGVLYSSHHNAGDRHASNVLVEMILGVDNAKAKEIIKIWVKSELLVSDDYNDIKARKTLKGLTVDWAKKPGLEIG